MESIDNSSKCKKKTKTNKIQNITAIHEAVSKRLPVQQFCSMKTVTCKTVTLIVCSMQGAGRWLQVSIQVCTQASRPFPRNVTQLQARIPPKWKTVQRGAFTPARTLECRTRISLSALINQLSCVPDVSS